MMLFLSHTVTLTCNEECRKKGGCERPADNFQKVQRCTGLSNRSRLLIYTVGRLHIKRQVDDMRASAWRNSECDDTGWIVYIEQENQVQHPFASVFNSGHSRARRTHDV